MAINLEKQVKQVKVVLDKIGFHEKVQVVLALDISVSMSSLYRSGVVQELVERLLAIGINMDVNEEIDVYLFGEKAHETETAYRGNIDGFVNQEIARKFPLEGSTYYAPVMKKIAKSFGHDVSVKTSFINKLIGRSEQSKDPVVVFFITDGENFDPEETEQFIKDVSSRPIFWQFVGIGGSRFSFLEKLDEMRGRTIDNANFFDAGDIAAISNDVLYNRILTELPDWHKEAKSKGIVK